MSAWLPSWLAPRTQGQSEGQASGQTPAPGAGEGAGGASSSFSSFSSSPSPSPSPPLSSDEFLHGRRSAPSGPPSESTSASTNSDSAVRTLYHAASEVDERARFGSGSGSGPGSSSRPPSAYLDTSIDYFNERFPASASSSSAAAVLSLDVRGDPESSSDLASSRLISLPLTAFGLGFLTGMYNSANKAGLVFMAENAHRRPDTVQGWYFYNKTKNYKVLYAGLTGGARTGLMIGSWVLAWAALEQEIGAGRTWVSNARFFPTSPFSPSFSTTSSYERIGAGSGPGLATATAMATESRPRLRLAGHWTDGGLAGLGVAAGAVLLYRLPRPTSLRTIFLGVFAGATAGALRDVKERFVLVEE